MPIKQAPQKEARGRGRAAEGRPAVPGASGTRTPGREAPMQRQGQRHRLPSPRAAGQQVPRGENGVTGRASRTREVLGRSAETGMEQGGGKRQSAKDE